MATWEIASWYATALNCTAVMPVSTGAATLSQLLANSQPQPSIQGQFMKITRLLRTPGIYSMIIALLFVSVQAPASAGMIGNAELLSQTELQLQRDEVRELVARDDVRDALLDYGVNPADVDTRLDNLTASELAQIQSQLADLPAGGNGVLGAVLGIILILVLLDVLGVTDVFPRI